MLRKATMLKVAVCKRRWPHFIKRFILEFLDQGDALPQVYKREQR